MLRGSLRSHLSMTCLCLFYFVPIFYKTAYTYIVILRCDERSEEPRRIIIILFQSFLKNDVDDVV